MLAFCLLVLFDEREVREVFFGFGVAGRRERVRDGAERDRFHLDFALGVHGAFDVALVSFRLVDGVPGRTRCKLLLHTARQTSVSLCDKKRGGHLHAKARAKRPLWPPGSGARR